MFHDIDNIPELYGAAVVYIDSNYTITELRPFDPSCSINPIKVVLREPPKLMNQKEFSGHLKGSQGNIRESKLVGELAGTVLSCGAAFLGWVAVFGSSTASTLQCINGGYRSYNERYDSEMNDFLDSN